MWRGRAVLFPLESVSSRWSDLSVWKCFLSYSQISDAAGRFYIRVNTNTHTHSIIMTFVPLSSVHLSRLWFICLSNAPLIAQLLIMKFSLFLCKVCRGQRLNVCLIGAVPLVRCRLSHTDTYCRWTRW